MDMVLRELLAKVPLIEPSVVGFGKFQVYDWPSNPEAARENARFHAIEIRSNKDNNDDYDPAYHLNGFPPPFHHDKTSTFFNS